MTTSDARKRIRENAAQAATTPSLLEVPGCEPDCTSDRCPTRLKNLAAMNAAQTATTPAPVAVPEGAAVLPEPFPRVAGTCPACGRSSLMLASGGYVTCASLSCRDPEAASNMLAPRPEPATAPPPSEALAEKRALIELVFDYRCNPTQFRQGEEALDDLVSEIERLRALLPAAADQRARDEGTVREEIAREIEAAAQDVENDRGMTTVEGETWEQAARIARGGTR